MMKKIIGIDTKFLPIKNFLEKTDDLKYTNLYKGLITIQSKIVHRPEILFLGINPGDGAYKAEKKTAGFPARIILSPKDYDGLKLDWLKDGNARGALINKQWVAYKWYERNEKINNSFPARMIDLLYYVAESYVDSKIYLDRDLFNARFTENLLDKVVYSNLYPIATKSTKELDKILSLLSKEHSLRNIWTTENKNMINKSDVHNFFRQRTIDLIEVLDPKIIVCLGNSAFRGLTSSKIKGQTKLSFTLKKLRISDITKYPILSISRAGNWHGNLKDAAQQIISATLKEVK